MAMDEFPAPDVPVESVDPAALRDRIESRESVYLLDVRAEDEFDEWRVQGESVESVNVPYFEFLAGGVEDDRLAVLPDDRRVTVLCAKGGASEYVAGLLAERGYDVDHLEDGMRGWARLYDYNEIDAGVDATVAQYQRPSSGCLAYLVVDDGEAAAFDPLRAFAAEYVQDARLLGADLEYAVDTHVHADHVSGVRALARDEGAQAVLPAAATDRGVDYDIDYETVEHGDQLVVGDTTIDVIYTPGHTSGMTTFRVGDLLLTGDGLFTESVARPDLEGGDAGAPEAAAQLYDSLTERVLPLHDDVRVAPAHFSAGAVPAADGTYTARLGDIGASMDALSMDRSDFVDFVLSDMPPRPGHYEAIIETNLGHRSPDDQRAFELELGPNNCAASRDALTGD